MNIQSTLESVFSWNDSLWFNYSVTLGVVYYHASEQVSQIPDQIDHSGVCYKTYDYLVHSGGGVLLELYSLWFNYSVTLGIVFKHAPEQVCQIPDQENDSGVHYKRYDYQVHSGGGTVLPELLTNKQW
jgi:hypothetical protein